MPASQDTLFRRRASSFATAGRVSVGFLALILVGTLLLALPIARNPGCEVSWLDSLFMATSATCLTGLATVNPGITYSRFGQGTLLALIQIGGLGITTAGTLFLLLRRGSNSLASEDFIGANVGKLRHARPIDVFIYSCLAVLGFELLGCVALTHLITDQEPNLPIDQAIWEAAFHSVSAFCNAGLSVYPEGLVRWRHHPLALLTASALVILGGIGLLTLVNFRYFYPWRRDLLQRGRLALQTRVCIRVTLILLTLGTLLTWINELDHTLKDQPWPRAFLWAFVHSTMTRTAGFNVVNTAEMAPETLLGSLVLMFIGGAPGSMTGGVKITTLVLLAVVARAALRRRSDLEIGRHTVSPEQAGNAVMVTLLSAVTLVLAVGLLMNSEAAHEAVDPRFRWLPIIFEAVSAFGTVGLSTGITPDLSPMGKTIIIVLMFLGRLGPLCLAMHLAQPPQPSRISFPREDLAVG